MVVQEYRFKINGTYIDSPPMEWEDIVIDVSFDTSEIQPTINIDTFTFVGDAKAIIDAHVKTRIFEGLDFSIEDKDSGLELYNGMLNFVTNFEEKEEIMALCALQQKDNIDFVDERLKGITFGLLKERGVALNYTNVSTTVIKKFDALDVAFLALATFNIYQMIADLIDKTAKSIADTLAPLKLIFNIIYIATVIILIFQMLKTIINVLIPPKGDYKGITFRDALIALYSHIGFKFESTIVDMDCVYLPSKKGESVRESRKEDGIPTVEDNEYVGANMVELVLNLFYAKSKVVGDTVHIEPLKSNYWKKKAPYVQVDVRTPNKKPNTSEAVATRMLTFVTDPSDDWTVDNFRGTSYEINTDSINYLKPDNKLLKGYDEDRFNVSLGTSKNEFSNLESALNLYIAAFNLIATVFGGNGNIQKIDIGRKLLKISQPYFNIPKVIKLDSSGLVSRDLFSAKYLWDTYHDEKSFVFNKQELIYEDIKIKFNIDLYKKALQNNYFHTFDGKEGIFTHLRWIPSSDSAFASYRIKEIYIEQLKETKIEPE